MRKNIWNLPKYSTRKPGWGAYIHNVGMPPKGHPFYDPQTKMRPLTLKDCNLESTTMEDCNLAGTTMEDCKIAGIVIENCNIKGLKIDGVDVSALLDEYRKRESL